MSWARLDDRMAFHPRIVDAGNAAVGLWARMIAYCSEHLTDGFVKASVARSIGDNEELRAAIDAGLIDCVDGGYRVHDYLQWNPSRKEVEKMRSETRSRVRTYRDRNALRNVDRNVCSNANVPDGMGSITDLQTPDPKRARDPSAAAPPGFFVDAWYEVCQVTPTDADALLQASRLSKQSALRFGGDAAHWAKTLLEEFLAYRLELAKKELGQPQLSVGKFVEHFPRCEERARKRMAREKAGAAKVASSRAAIEKIDKARAEAAPPDPETAAALERMSKL